MIAKYKSIQSYKLFNNRTCDTSNLMYADEFDRKGSFVESFCCGKQYNDKQDNKYYSFTMVYVKPN